jgi:hypothetical protein
MKYPGEVIERLSALLHEVYQEETERQGNSKYTRKYEDLPENIKELDRVLARWILTNFIARSWSDLGL